jgi:hypothetical protein
MLSTTRVSMVFVVLTTIGGCAGSVSGRSVPARAQDGGVKAVPADGATDRCPATSRTSTAGGIAACPVGPLSFEKPRALLSAASLGREVTFQALYQYAIVATRAGEAGVQSFVVKFTIPPTPGAAVGATVLELPASDQSRSIVAIGPQPSNASDKAQFEALACSQSECSFFVARGAALERDPMLPSIPKDDYQRVECRRPGDTCDLCVESPTARLCFAAGSLETDNVAPPDLALCCPIAPKDLRWAMDADFRALSRFALTRSGDLVNDEAVSRNGVCCVQGSGFNDAVGFDVIVCGASSNPMILTGSTLYGTTSCVISH